jgi:hypothetical protein
MWGCFAFLQRYLWGVFPSTAPRSENQIFAVFPYGFFNLGKVGYLLLFNWRKLGKNGNFVSIENIRLSVVLYD